MLLAASFSLLPKAAALPSYDPFADATGSGGTAYTPGSNLVGQNNNTLFGAWYLRGGNFGSTQPTIASGSLSYSNMPPSSGNSVAFSPAASQSACIDLNLASGQTNAVYASFLLKVTDLAAVSTTAANNPFVAFGDDPSLSLTANQIGRLGTRLLAKKVGSGYVLGTSRSATTGDFVYEPDAAAHSINEVVFVVMCYDRPVAASQPNVSLWINPPLATLGSNQPPAPTVSATAGTTALNSGNARIFAIMCQFAGAPSGLIDDVRVATNNWAYVTGGDPAILTNPTNRVVAPNASASFNVAARGTATLSYQWIKDGTTPLSNVGNISGATSPTLTINNVGAGDVGTYAAYVTNGVGNAVLSASASLALLTDPIITNQPASVWANYSSNVTFTVGAGGTQPIGYQWHKVGFGDLNDGGNISGSHSATLSLSGIAFPDSGEYYVTVSNNLGTVDSAAASLTVADPFFASNPASVTTNQGATVAFHAVALGSGSITYQWLKNGNLIFNNPPYSGADSDTLTIANVSATEAANYSLTAIGPYSNAVSTIGVLSVLSPVSITAQPRPRTVVPGVKVGFSVAVAGSGPFTYQWRRDGGDVAGATASTYMVTNAQPAVGGGYQVVISNSFSSITSSVAALAISNSLTLAETNLVIIRVGDGVNGLSINGSAVFLDQYTDSGSYVNTITIPDDGPTALAMIGFDNINGVNSGATTGSLITRSLDGRFMVIAGYNTNLSYGASLGSSVAATVPRGIGLIDSFGTYSLPVASTNNVYDANQSFWRAGITDGTNNFWGASATVGTYYFGFDAPPAVVQTNFVNTRSARLYNGDMYYVQAQGSAGVLKVSGLPKTLTTGTNLFGGSTGSFDLAVNPAGDLIYLTDQRNVANGGGIQRWEFNGTSWTLAYTLNTGFGPLGPRYIVGDFSGASPVLYVTANDQSFDNNRLIRVVDTGAASAGTALANAGANQTFRGLQFGPVPNTVFPRPTLTYQTVGNNLVLSWTGSFTLISSTNVVGPYFDVSGATSPYTNSVSTDAQRYFGLRQ